MPLLFLRDLLVQGTVAESESGLTLDHFPCVLGRHSACDYRLDAPFISRRHCYFSLKDGRVWVEDLRSRNGTTLNETPLTGPQPLEDGDVLAIGGLPFQVRLEGVEAVSAPARAREEPAAEESRRVLVVEDDADAAATLARLLQAWGHDVGVARDGLEALRLAREWQPDTVLLDIRLPGMSGFQVAEHLRRQPGLGKALLVGVTGLDTAAEGERPRECGLDRVLPKPVNPAQLQEVLGQSH